MSRRRAGILLHITSLPGAFSFGDISNAAYKFIDFLLDTGFSVWQILPLGPTHTDHSPYQSLSAHAGNPQLINLEWLYKKGWLNLVDLYAEHEDDWQHRLHCLQLAYKKFKIVADPDDIERFQRFISKNKYWLENYSLYIALREQFENQAWMLWPVKYRDRDSDELAKFFKQNQKVIEAIQFQQFIFFTQWADLKKYANDRGVFIIGDIPIFVAHDSAEVWVNRDYFKLNANGQAEFVAGVPPDFFSETGQLWGNPHYQWKKLEEDDFCWWVDRIRTQSNLYDAIRIDHFRGLAQYWEIPANEKNAINGSWVSAPGRKLLRKLTQSFPTLSLLAEDLGTITPDVIELRDEFRLPGMLILQFAFDGSYDNPYLPHNHRQNSLVYTGTHDNDTTLSWYESLSTETKNYVNQYIYYENEYMPWPLIRSALDSVANLAILPMQDLLSLGEGHRMNTPGTVEGNWQWRFEWNQIDDGLKRKISDLLRNSHRTTIVKSASYSSSQVMQPTSNL